MSNPNDARVVSATVTTRPVPFRMPLKFGGRVVDRTHLIDAEVTLEGRGGRTAVGRGSMPVGNVWSWPAADDQDAAEAAMIDFAGRAAAALPRDFGHPVETMHAAIAGYADLAAAAVEGRGGVGPMPLLARLVAASPVDAAVHDAYGHLHGRSSFACLSGDFMNADLAAYLDDRFAGDFLDMAADAEPRPRLPLYHLVGALDPLTDGDVTDRPDDGLPVTLGEWVAADGLTHLKIKLAGDDLAWDVDRVLAVDRVAEETRPGGPWDYSADFNEKCDSAEYVVEFLDRVREASPAAYDRIQYLEQPTARDLSAPGQADVSAAAARKPVVIDESLDSYESLLRARELGYSGVALKACKGQTESLLAAAAARKFGMFLCVQDLTCPGASFLHSASLAAHVKGVAAIEGNGRQYCPAPNAEWAGRYPGMFEVTGGTVRTAELSGEGLGFS